MGKSALAIHVAHRLVNNVQVIYIDVGEMDKINTFSYIQSRIGTILSKEMSIFELYKWSESLNCKILLLFDNYREDFEKNGDFQEIVTKLIEQSSYKSLKILITTRERVTYMDEKHRIFHIKELPLHSACQLLYSIVNSNIINEEVNVCKEIFISGVTYEEIIDIVGGMPLMLHAIGESSHPEELVSQLRENFEVALSSKQLQRVYDSIFLSYHSSGDIMLKYGRIYSLEPEPFVAEVLMDEHNNFIEKLMNRSLVEGTYTEKRGYNGVFYEYQKVIRAFFRSKSTADEVTFFIKNHLSYHTACLQMILNKNNRNDAMLAVLFCRNGLISSLDILIANRDIQIDIDLFVQVADKIRYFLKYSINKKAFLSESALTDLQDLLLHIEQALTILLPK